MSHFFLLVVLALTDQAPVCAPAPLAPVHSAPLIREEQAIVVNGVPEVWRLEWKSSPRPICSTAEEDMPITCPCFGFAYGESGKLDLVRSVRDREIDRLELTPFFEHTVANGDAILPRWEFRDKDLDDYKAEGFAERVRSRPIVKIMHFADFNNDGSSTEFYLQTDAGPCGKSGGIVVGVSPSNSRLHAFATAAHPRKALMLQRWEWKALLTARVPTEVRDWGCGDHGSESQTFLTLQANNGAIHVTLREFECGEVDKRGRLIRMKVL